MENSNFKVGILLTGHAADQVVKEHNEVDRQFEKLLSAGGFDFQTYAIVDDEFPDGIYDADGWLITGSKAGVYEDHPWIAPLEQFVRDAYENKRPTVGICFGHQLIAQALGGKVVKFDGGWALGPKDYELSDGKGSLTLNAFHQDQVIVPPEEARVIASNEFCQNAALMYGEQALSWQPHPEFDETYVTAVLNARSVNLPDNLVKNAREAMGTVLSNDIVAKQIIDFFNQHEKVSTMSRSA